MIKNRVEMKRVRSDSGASVDKRPRLSASEIDESKESEALIEQFDASEMDVRTGCIYLITNKINGKVYVGLSIDYKRRWKQHEYSANNPKYHFSYAIRKHGWENFKKEILIDNVHEQDLGDLEIQYIALYDSYSQGYNLTKGGEGSLGHIFTEEELKAKSKSHTKNHDIEGGGSVSFSNREKKWVVKGCKTTGSKPIGMYFTKEKAIEALELYNTTGERLPSDITQRIKGTGCVFFHQQHKRWTARVKNTTGRKYIGQYFTKKKAIEALELYKETGECILSDVISRRRGTGCVYFHKHQQKWSAMGPTEAKNAPKHIGMYFTKEKANQAVDLYNETGKIMPSDTKQRRNGTGSIEEYSTKTMGKRYIGSIQIKGKKYCTKAYGSGEVAQSELDKLISKFL